MSRYATVTTDTPGTATEPDGTTWTIINDNGPACDVRGPHGTCRLPTGHDGEHMWFTDELVKQTGIRLKG